MPRGKGIKSKICHCRYPPCGQNFKSCREDATTCSAACRKALNRLLGGDDEERRQAAVTDSPDANGTIYRVLLDGRHVTTKPTRWEAERAIAGWLDEFDGEFEVKPLLPRVKR